MPRTKKETTPEAELETTPRPYDASDERDNAVKPEEPSTEDDSDE